MADPVKQKRVLLPQYYPARGQFRLNGVPSGQEDAIARVNMTLEPFPHWVMGVRVVNVYVGGDALTLEDQANLALSRVDDLQEIRLVVGTYEIFPFAAQETIVGSRKHWHPFPMRMGIRGGVNVVVEARRIVEYPLNIIPELAVTLVTVSARVNRPGDTFDIDVVT